MKATLHGLRWAVVLLCVYWLAIFIGTHLPPKAMLHLRASDKLMHATAFAGLAFLLAWAIPTHPVRRWKNVWIAIAICLVYAIFDELSQIPVGRSADILDFLADSVGIAIGISIYVFTRAVIFASGWKYFESHK